MAMSALLPGWTPFLMGLAAGFLLGYYWFRWSSGQIDNETAAYEQGYYDGEHARRQRRQEEADASALL